MQIIPSILEHKADDYIDQISRLSLYLNHFQIDIADGILVPNKTALLKEILQLLTNNPQLVFKNHFDFHLMVSDPTPYIDHIKALKSKISINTIFIHYKSLSSLTPFSFFVNNYSDLAQIGLVINPEEEINTISKTITIRSIPIVQIMTIIPGMQGSAFKIELLKKIGQLRDSGYRNKIAVDGGVNLETIQLMISQNQIPDIICPGSYFSKATNLKECVEKLNQLTFSIPKV